MIIVNQYLPTVPFDIYELHLFHLVAKHASFTKAAEIAGLTQSAITRQVQGMEASLGFALFKRTTRSVRPTSAGEFLLTQTHKILGDVDATLRQLMRNYATQPKKEVRVGVSRTMSLAHLPGLFFASRRKHPDVLAKVRHESSQTILSELEANELDVGVVCPPARLPKSLQTTHQFEDEFALIAPGTFAPPAQGTAWGEWLAMHPLLLIHEECNTGRLLREWLERRKISAEPAMRMDNFDLIVNLVALGMGVGFVPRRALATYPRKKSIQQIHIPERFTRTLAVLTRKRKSLPPHIAQFVENILF